MFLLETINDQVFDIVDMQLAESVGIDLELQIAFSTLNESFILNDYKSYYQSQNGILTESMLLESVADNIKSFLRATWVMIKKFFSKIRDFFAGIWNKLFKRAETIEKELESIDPDTLDINKVKTKVDESYVDGTAAKEFSSSVDELAEAIKNFERYINTPESGSDRVNNYNERKAQKAKSTKDNVNITMAKDIKKIYLSAIHWTKTVKDLKKLEALISASEAKINAHLKNAEAITNNQERFLALTIEQQKNLRRGIASCNRFLTELRSRMTDITKEANDAMNATANAAKQASSKSSSDEAKTESVYFKLI